MVALDQAGYATTAVADRALATLVARHKNAFFREKDAGGDAIDYVAAARGNLLLVPEGDRLAILADDYERMVADGLLLSPPTPFGSLLDRCRNLQGRVNAAAL